MMIMFMMASIIALPMQTMAAAPTVVISEVAWAGSSLSSSDEWLELTNLSTEAIDVSGWTLTGASAEVITLPENSVINSYSTFLISNYAAPSEHSLLSSTNYSTTTLSLSNGGFSLSLNNHDGTQVDSAGDGGAPFAGRSGGTKDADDGFYRSMVRSDVTLDGSSKDAWMSADDSVGFVENTADLGSPGVYLQEPPVLNLDDQVTDETGDEVVEETDEEPEPELDLSHLLTYPDGDLFINAFVSDPAGEDVEWIEIVNTSDASVDTALWTVEDAIGGSTPLGEMMLEKDSVLRIDSPKGKLNNGGDTIYLKNSEGNIVDLVAYGTDNLPALKDGEAASRDDLGIFMIVSAPAPEEIEDTEPEVVDEEAQATEAIEEVEESTSTEPDVSSLSPGTLLINEFVSDPLDQEDEWIELVNRSDSTVNTSAWTIEDATGRITELESTQVAPGDYLLVEKPRGKLNNSGDVIILRDNQGNVVDEIEYGTELIAAPKNGEAMARNGDVFVVTQISTPNSPNLIVEAFAEMTPDEPEEEEVVNEEVLVDEEVIEKIESPVFTTSVLFTEFYPNTTGSDATEETMSIKNIGDQAVQLKDWVVKDASEKSYVFDENLTLNPGETHLLERIESNIALNNTGDSVQLFAPDGTLIDQVDFGKAAKGSRYVLTGTTWSWTAPPQTTASVATTSTTSSNQNSSTTHTSTSSNTPSSYTIEAAKKLSNGTDVSVSGVITVSPGVYGRQTIYIQDETGGVQIYKYDGEFGEAKEGDVVRVIGELSSSSGERRIKITSDGSMNVTGVKDATVAFISTKLVTEDYLGSLIKTHGLVYARSSSKITLEDNSNQAIVYLKATPQLNSEQFERGSEVTITGVLTRSGNELRIRPRSQDDIEIHQVEEVIGGASVDSDGSTLASTREQTGWILLLATLAAFGILAIRYYMPTRRRQAAA